MATGVLSPQVGASAGSKFHPSSKSDIDEALGVLTAHKEAWAQGDIPLRLALLDQIEKDLPSIEGNWVTEGMAAKGARPETFAEGEEWYSLTVMYRYIHFLRKALQDILQFGDPKIPGKVTTRANGQVVAQVVPSSMQESFALPGVHAEVWMDPSVSMGNGGIPQASFYHSEHHEGSVCAVLGAGNVGALVPGDFMEKLFVEGQVVALKMHPVNQYFGPMLEIGFRALIEAGFLRILYGGADEGTYLVNHPAVDNVHMTGSDRTFEAIIFGPGEEGRKRKAAHHPSMTKPFTAELSNISPIIVVPGPWTKQDVKEQAARLGSWLVPNSAHNCLTPRLIIQMKDWEQREALNKGIADFLKGIPSRTAYYPGSFKVYEEFTEAHPDALRLGNPGDGQLPWTFIRDVDTSNENDICFRQEPFISLFSETSLNAEGVVDFIDKAVAFANDKLWGTLVATIVVHPKSMKDPGVGAAVNRAIERLEYGSIVINSWGAMAHYMTLTPWGGYPGHDIYDEQSGIGFVNNPLMFDRIQKSVVYADFKPMADPFLANTTNNYLWFRQDTRYQHDPSVMNLMNLIWKAMRIKQVKAPEKAG